VGSVKSNIGHLESCAALAGLVKTIECLERQLVPPQMHFESPNPKIDFTNISIPTSVLPWPENPNGGKRRAAINSFGFGGVNAHTVLEEAPLQKLADSQEEDAPKLFKLSASTDVALSCMLKSMADYVEAKRPNLTDLAHTLVARRTTLKRSVFVSATTHEGLLTRLRATDVPKHAVTKSSEVSETPQRIGFIFTGQGAQWPGMGAELLKHSALFHSVVQQCDDVLRSLPDAPSWTAADELSKDKASSRVHVSSLSQPLCTIVQLGLVEIWRSWGVVPCAVVGHSSGEVAAAYAAGLLSLRDAVVVAFYRGLYLGSDGTIVKPKGGMCAVGLSEASAKQLLRPYAEKVGLAAVNSPSSCTLSGDIESVQEIAEQCKQDGTFCRVLRVDMAYHSHHMLEHASKYEDAMRQAGVVSLSSPESRIQMYSSVYERHLSPTDCSPSYWKQNMTSPVLFTSALKTMMSDSERPYALVELGPHPALKGPVGDTLADIGITEVPYFSSLFRGKPDVEAMYESAGTMIAVGIDLDTIRVNATQKHAVDSGAPFSVTYSTGRVLKDLPTYPWDHTVSHWHESRASKNVRFRQFPRHNLLGARLSEDTSLHMGWSNTLSFKETPWLADLGKKSQEFLPETVLICMALEAARQFAVLRDLQESSVQMKSLEFESSVPLSWFKDESGVETQLALDTNGHVSGGAFTISVLSNRESDVWVKACQGTLVLATSNPARGTTLKSRIATAQLKHDAQFEERIRTSGYTQPEKSTGFTVNPRSATGNIDGLDHSVLSAILQLPQMLVRGSGLPGKYRVRSIKTLETHSVPIPPTAPAAFLAEVEQSGSVTGVVSVDVAAMADSPGFISIQGLNVERYDDMAIEAPLKSLFYKSELAPDISSSSFSAEGLMRIEDIISLVTHKHPDADIGLVGLDGQVIKTVLEALRAYRPRFRSVTVVGDYPSMEEMTLSAVSVVPRLASSAKLHLLLEPLEAEAESQDLEAHLHPQGVRFTTSASDSSTWTLTRQQKHNTPSDVPVTIISSPSAAAEDPPYADALRASFPLSDHLTMSSESAMPNPKHVIIIDGPTSMLARTPATVWLAQLQSVISSVETLLWVNIQRNSDPFSSVAGSFIRTLKAEDPTLRAASLVISDPSSSARIAELVKTVFHDLHSGASEETELVVQSDSVHLLRYVPDDERNASTGAASPVYVQRNIAKSEYALAVTAREHVALRSASPRIQHQMKAGTVLVDVSASTIDHADVSEFLSPKEGSSLGLFFAGRVRKSASKTISPGMQVVGWMAGAHRSSVECTEQNIFTLSHEVDPKDAAVCFAAAASAYAILDGFARIRFGDYFDLRVSGLLATAISKLCDIYGATVSETCPKTADFVIAYDAQKLTVNSRPVSVKHYLESGDRVHAMIRLFGQLLDHDGGVSARAFEIDSIGDAFAFAATKPLEVVIKHKSNDAILPVLVMHNPAPKLFSSDGAYILLGGMGGLGQHLSTWMIRNGAKTLITISRSGLSNEEARSTAQQVESLGGEVEAFALDVSDAAALNTALSDVRSRHKILGCLNLAMVLQDAPFSKMTAQRWDTAMRVKVEGSWNLHQATLADDLDFYLLFSSVSSITGNRSQSNYATGNAFQNALAAYRRSIGIPGISIALGSMSGIGVLANETALEYCAQMGHSTVGPAELEQVMESAIISSQNPDCPPLMGMGLEIFEKIDGTVQKTAAQSQVSNCPARTACETYTNFICIIGLLD
jgi:acyl transferase domain-containing protein